jgi:hypothetical protein
MHNNESLAILAIKICLFEHECTNNNKFTVSRVKAVQGNKENEKIILIAIGNVLKNKYIHIVNNIVCVFQMSIIMQILSNGQ